VFSGQIKLRTVLTHVTGPSSFIVEICQGKNYFALLLYICSTTELIIFVLQIWRKK